jgi:nucleotide-binding universal stress UspA family protein
MGTRGLTGIDHLLIGSTAEQVVRMAPCPVLTVRAADRDEGPASRVDGTPEFTNIQHIVVPVDFSIFAQEAVECVVPIAERFNAEVYLVHVLERYVYVSGLHGFTTRSAVDENVRERMSGQMKKLIQMFHDRGLQATSRICEGIPDEQIVKAAEETHADLIVMGTHGRTGLHHTLIGSIAEKVVRRSPCPVVTVKSPTFKFAAP